MRAVAVFPGRRELRLVDHPAPEIAAPTEVKLRVLEVGVCGTDREIVSWQYGAPPPGSDHLILGHESLAEILEVGGEVTEVAPGDLAVISVRRPCPHPSCLPCRSGRQDFCSTGDFTERGIKQAHGFMTELVVDDQRYLTRVPPELREVAVLTEPLTIAEKALAQVALLQQRLPWACPVTPGGPPQSCHNAVVLGAGPVGLLGAMALVARGFVTTVYSRASGPHDKARLVESFGAQFVASEATSVEDLAAGIGNVDLVYEASGASRVAFDLMRILGTNGVYVFTGVPGRKAPVELDTALIMRNLVLQNQVLLGTVNAAREAFDDAIADLALFDQRWPEALRRLVTVRCPLEGAPELLQGEPGGIKNVITLT